jgi:hypothetical protein
MDFKALAAGFVTIGLIAFVVNLIVAYLYTLLVHGTGVLEWETSTQMAFLLGIIIPIVREVEKKKV